MSAEMICGLISALASAMVSVIGLIVNGRLTAYRIEQLEKKVEKHNNIIDRMYMAEQKIAVIDEEIKVANHRIEDLEKAI